MKGALLHRLRINLKREDAIQHCQRKKFSISSFRSSCSSFRNFFVQHQFKPFSSGQGEGVLRFNCRKAPHRKHEAPIPGQPTAKPWPDHYRVRVEGVHVLHQHWGGVVRPHRAPGGARGQVPSVGRKLGPRCTDNNKIRNLGIRKLGIQPGRMNEPGRLSVATRDDYLFDND